MITMLDLAEQYRTLQPEIDRVMQEVAASGHYIMGPQVAAFEQELAAFLGAPRALGCASGTDALFLSLQSLGVGPGDEVITSPFSFIATSGTISQCGARPVFADVDPLRPACSCPSISSAAPLLCPSCSRSRVVMAWPWWRTLPRP